MGLDNVYQAMPENCSLLERSRYDADFGANLTDFEQCAAAAQEEIDERGNDQTYLDFVSAAKLLCKERPQLFERRLFLGRRWDMIHYLLSEERRRGYCANDSDWVKRFIHGGEVLNEYIKDISGHHIFYLAPGEVSELWIKLGDITSETFREHWNPSLMYEAGVYKMHAADDERQLEYIETDFNDLRNLFFEAMTHDEGILNWCF